MRTILSIIILVFFLSITACSDGNNVTPTATIATTTQTALPAALIEFSAETDIQAGEVASYEWSFGDENSATGEKVSHSYMEPGTYEVELTVIDSNNKRSTSSETIIIQPPFTLPIEVIGASGHIESAQFIIDDAEGINNLYLQCNRCGYRDSSVNATRGAKGAIRLNGGDWIDLSDSVADVYEPEKNYGGIAGAYYTVRFIIPINGIISGLNTIDFRFNATDGITNGYRIVALNFLRNQESVIRASWFQEDDPNQWVAPLTNEADLAAGEVLWSSATLFESPLSNNTMRATCADCHARDGRDLKYFNFSNKVIIARSKFHGLSQLEAEQVASYIRTLNVPAPQQARPWNPPYQPGPGLDSKPVTEWAAGAGLEWALDDDSEMLPHLFPSGLSEAELAKVIDSGSTLNVREMPIALQFPDWNAWLPEVHPKDTWGELFLSGEAQQSYESIHRELNGNPLVDLLSEKDKLLNLLSTLPKSSSSFISRDLLNCTSTCSDWRVKESGVMNARRSDINREEAKLGIAKWIAVKSWEVMQEYNLEDKASAIMDSEYGEARGWPNKQFGVFTVAPHMVADNITNFTDRQSALVGVYQSTAWYQLQMTLNAGMRQFAGTRPIDWPYQLIHVREFSKLSGVQQPLRMAQSVIKAIQIRDNGATTRSGGGWHLRTNTPMWYLADENGDETLFEALDNYQADLRITLTEALLLEWLDVNGRFDLSIWGRTLKPLPAGQARPGNAIHYNDHPRSRFLRWRWLEYEEYIPTAWNGNGKLWDQAQNRHADNIYRMVPFARRIGVNEAILDQIIDWGRRAWPRGNWSALRR